MSAPRRFTPGGSRAAVLTLLLAGASRTEICAALSLAPTTVNHLSRALILDAGARDTHQLVAWTLGRRLAEQDARVAALEMALAAFERRSGRERRVSPPA